MSDRDVTKTYARTQFVDKLRRLADAIELNEAFMIMVDGERLRIPKDAEFNIEHEREGDTQEIEFQLTWPATSTAEYDDQDKSKDD